MTRPTHNELPNPERASEIPEDLILSEDEQARVDRLSDTMTRQEALQRTVSRSKAERIIGYEESARILKQLAEQPDRPEPGGPSHDELVELFRVTYSTSASESENSTDKEV